ncbi:MULTISPECIES: hypothetical protein [unclassified Synechococcus]|uniref:hypothetical protein n=1 Tax=unclassified Synechococcus TaxID=2626047 RepID=UPI001C2343BE|nr:MULTISPECIES: hypothetical protein [unclassified Synechococcus]
MPDFLYRGVAVADTWSTGACRPGSQTRFNSRRRVDGSQRWSFELPSGEPFYAFTQAEAMAAIRLLEK